jgi:hypothetical protein
MKQVRKEGVTTPLQSVEFVTRFFEQMFGSRDESGMTRPTSPGSGIRVI